MKYFVLILVVATAAVKAQQCNTVWSGIPEPGSINYPAPDVVLVPGIADWTVTYYPPCEKAVLEVTVCDDVKPEIVFLSPVEVVVARKGSLQLPAVVHGSFWCPYHMAGVSGSLQNPVTVAL